MSEIKLENISKIYPPLEGDKENKDGVLAVNNFNIDIKDREFIVLVGPSGCGKSTVLRMIAGLEEITEGNLYIDGRLSNMLEPKERNIAMVFQTYALYPHMTVFENLEFPLEMEGIDKDKRDEMVREVAEKLEIDDLLKRKPKALSGGQRQRVAIGRAIVRNPKVLLMDEPLSNLDAKLRSQMRAELIKLRNQIEATFVYVTHDQTEAMTLGDRIVVMKDGIIQQVGTPSEIYDNPKNLFVATFIGSPQINIIEGELEISNGKVLKLDSKEIDVTDSQVFDNINENKNLIIGIRPEQVKIADENSSGEIKAEFEFNEILGSEMHIHFTFQNRDFIVVESKSEYEKNRHDKLNFGEKVDISFNIEDTKIFDKETEENLNNY